MFQQGTILKDIARVDESEVVKFLKEFMDHYSFRKNATRQDQLLYEQGEKLIQKYSTLCQPQSLQQG